MGRHKKGIKYANITIQVPKKELALWKKKFYILRHQEDPEYIFIKENPTLSLKDVASALNKRKPVIRNFCKRVDLPVPKDV